jgi:hypothetical protein
MDVLWVVPLYALACLYLALLWYLLMSVLCSLRAEVRGLREQLAALGSESKSRGGAHG